MPKNNNLVAGGLYEYTWGDTKNRPQLGHALMLEPDTGRRQNGIVISRWICIETGAITCGAFNTSRRRIA